MNKNDSEHLAGMMEFSGYTESPTPEKADIWLLNTCAIRDKSERKLYGQLNILNHLREKSGKNQKILVTGCVPAYDQDKVLKKAPFVDEIVDISEARQYPAKRKDKSAWISITYGCNNFCSYCIVPYTRGPEVSRPVEDILQELASLDFSKYENIVLLGQNVNSYQGASAHETTTSFAELIQIIIEEFPDIPQIDFLTSHPKDVSDELISLIANTSKIGRELHFPLQAGNNRILQLMNRKYTYENYLELVAKIRKADPNILISTDLIVGFPGETQDEFEDTLKAVKEGGFYRINSAAYSPRAGTKAAKMANQLPEEEKNSRLNILNKLIKEYAIVHNKSS